MKQIFTVNTNSVINIYLNNNKNLKSFDKVLQRKKKFAFKKTKPIPKEVYKKQAA